MASLSPAPVSVTISERLNTLLHVKDVEKSTICTWYLALFMIFAVVYLIQIAGILVSVRNVTGFVYLVFALLVDLIVLANLYFYYAMCEKLPEGFIGAIVKHQA